MDGSMDGWMDLLYCPYTGDIDGTNTGYMIDSGEGGVWLAHCALALIHDLAGRKGTGQQRQSRQKSTHINATL
jgi:hypothetical protein